MRITAWLLVLLTVGVRAERIDVAVSRLPETQLYLASYRGDEYTVASQAKTDSAGFYSFSLADDAPAGLYRIGYGNRWHLNVILNGEDVSLVTSHDHPVDSMRVTGSAENRTYYEYLKLEKFYGSGLDLLLQVIDRYPAGTEFRTRAIQEFKTVQARRDSLIDAVIARNPSSWAASIIAVLRPVTLPAAGDAAARMTSLKKHFFDQTDFGQAPLLRTNVYTHKVISYIGLHRDTRLNREEQGTVFLQVVKDILPRIRTNRQVYTFLVDYLVKGFEKFGFDAVVQYIAENAVLTGTCENKKLASRLEGYRKLKPGSTAPPLSMKDSKGKKVSLRTVDADRVLVVFWATWCPHCTELIPRLHDWYAGRKDRDTEVIAVSLDDDRAAWAGFTTRERLGWINACDFKKWESPAAAAWYVSATPVMFLLDKERKIIGKPGSVSALKNMLGE